MIICGPLWFLLVIYHLTFLICHFSDQVLNSDGRAASTVTRSRMGLVATWLTQSAATHPLPRDGADCLAKVEIDLKNGI
jgi:hypothetical protein